MNVIQQTIERDDFFSDGFRVPLKIVNDEQLDSYDIEALPKREPSVDAIYKFRHQTSRGTYIYEFTGVDVN